MHKRPLVNMAIVDGGAQTLLIRGWIAKYSSKRLLSSLMSWESLNPQCSCKTSRIAILTRGYLKMLTNKQAIFILCSIELNYVFPGPNRYIILSCPYKIDSYGKGNISKRPSLSCFSGPSQLPNCVKIHFRELTHDHQRP